GSIEAGAKLADIDGDRVRDVVVGTSDGLLHVYSMGTGLPVEAPGFPVSTRLVDGLNDQLTTEPTVPSYLAATVYARGGIDKSIAREAIASSPAIADVNGDGENEIAFTTWAGTIHLVDATGAPMPGWPKRLPLVPSCPLDPSRPAPGACMDATHVFAR